MLKLVTRGEYFGGWRCSPPTRERRRRPSRRRFPSLTRRTSTRTWDRSPGPSQQAKDEYGVAATTSKVANDGCSLAAKAMTDKVKAVLGVGAFGKVLLCRHPSSEGVFAVKQLSKAQIIAAQLQHHVRRRGT